MDSVNTEGLWADLNSLTSESEMKSYYWSPFALKDTRELIRDGVLKGTVTRLRERLSKASAVFDMKRMVLWSKGELEQERQAHVLLVFQAEPENPHHVRLHIHQSAAFAYADLDNALSDELKQYFVVQEFWRISTYIKVEGQGDSNPANGTATFLDRLGFVVEARLPDFYLDGVAPQAADLWRWDISANDFEAFFLPYADGALIVSGTSEKVEAIYFCALGEEILDGQTFLKAYKLGCADTDAKLTRIKRGKKGDLSENMRVAYNELKAYLAGKNITFSFAIGEAGGSAFQQQVWEELKAIPYGVTLSYLDVARRLAPGDEGKAHRLARAVGSACSANPLCIVTPCHRVIGSDNSLTGFIGGVHFKARLLDMEMLGLSGPNSEEENE